MKRRPLSTVILIVLLFTRCGGNLKKDFIENFQKGPNGKEIPEPKFDKPTADILNELKVKYDATSVRLGRPFTYSTGHDLKYWIKVAFLNPELRNKSTVDFEKEVATNIANHLINPADFDQIEIAVTQKKGFIVTFSQSQNAFFSVDSLRRDGSSVIEPVN